MRIINISFALLLLCSFKPLTEMAVIKGEGSPESSQGGNSGETTQTPEGTDVLPTKPETDSLNDVALPQLRADLNEPEPSSSDTPLAKRCARPETLRSRSGGPRVSLARRDLTTRKQLCETCQKSIFCRNQNPCARCNRWCDSISPTTTEKNDVTTNRPEEKREVTDPPTKVEANDVIVTSRLKENDDKVSRYYSVASVETGPVMRLFEKLFNLPTGFDKFIILGRLPAEQVQDFPEIIVTDLAQAFGDNKKTKIHIHKFENENEALTNVKLVQLLNEKLNQLSKRKLLELGHGQLTLDEVNTLIDEAMGEVSDSVRSTQEHTTGSPEAVTRCNVDEAVENIVDMLPSGYAGPSKKEKPQKSHGEHETSWVPHVEPHVVETEVSSEIKNPPVIQDNLHYVGKTAQTPTKNLEDDYVDDTEEGRPTLITENKNQPPIQEATRLITIPKETNSTSTKTIVGEAPDNRLSLSDAKQIPSSDNQVNGPTVQEGTNFDDEPANPSRDLEKNVFKIVEDSLKAVTNGQSPNEEEAEPQSILVAEQKPSQANSESVIKTYEKPQLKDDILQIEENLEPTSSITTVDGNTIEEKKKPEQTTKKPRPSTNFDYQDPTQLSIDDLDPIPDVPNVAETAPDFQNRGQFTENTRDGQNDFGSLVPAKGVSTDVDDPRMKKYIYVGKNINLPLKMFQDEDGVMKLRVDTEALCNCKNENCTKKHVDERFRTALRENEDDQNAKMPELNVRFGRDSHHSDNLMDSFVESLHDHSETSEVFKRSPKIDSGTTMNVEDEEIKGLDNEKVEMENEIRKLSEDIEKYDKANKELFNKGTLSVFRDVEKTKNVDRMITLANNLLVWMKDFAMKHLET